MDAKRNLALPAREGKEDVSCCDQVINVSCPVGELHPNPSSRPVGHLRTERRLIVGCADTGAGEPPFDLHSTTARQPSATLQEEDGQEGYSSFPTGP